MFLAYREPRNSPLDVVVAKFTVAFGATSIPRNAGVLLLIVTDGMARVTGSVPMYASRLPGFCVILTDIKIVLRMGPPNAWTKMRVLSGIALVVVSDPDPGPPNLTPGLIVSISKK